MRPTEATGAGGGFTAVQRGPEARDAASRRGTKDAWIVGSAASPLTFRLPVRVLMRSLDCTALTMLSAWASVVGSAAAVCTTACAAVTFCTAAELLSPIWVPAQLVHLCFEVTAALTSVLQRPSWNSTEDVLPLQGRALWGKGMQAHHVRSHHIFQPGSSDAWLRRVQSS